MCIINVFTSTEIDCGQVQPPQNGSVTTESRHLYGDRITFSCDIGHELHGHNEALCLHTGNWSNEVPQCKRKFSDHIILFLSYYQ